MLLQGSSVADTLDCEKPNERYKCLQGCMLTPSQISFVEQCTIETAKNAKCNEAEELDEMPVFVVCYLRMRKSALKDHETVTAAG